MTTLDSWNVISELRATQDEIYRGCFEYGERGEGGMMWTVRDYLIRSGLLEEMDYYLNWR